MQVTKARAVLMGPLAFLVALTALIATPAGPANAEPPPPDFPANEWLCRYPGKNEIVLTPGWTCDHAGAFGVVQLARRTGGYTIEICNYEWGTHLHMRVDVANPDGSSSGRVLTYTDVGDSRCYIRNIGYPVRKFRAEVEEIGWVTVWMEPPS